MGFQRLVIECDAQVVVQFLNHGVDADHLYVALAAIICESLSNDWEVRVNHVYREANVVGDFLASLTHNQELGVHVLSNPPIGFSMFLLSDVVRAPLTRFVRV